MGEERDKLIKQFEEKVKNKSVLNFIYLNIMTV